MKIRKDFVSNSSSTSFIVFIKNEDATKYAAMFDELIYEKATSKKLFEWILVDISKISATAQAEMTNNGIIWHEGISDLQTLNFDHSNEFNYDIEEYRLVDFQRFLIGYSRSEYKKELIDSVILFVSESCWDQWNDDYAERYAELRDFLTSKSINYLTQEAFV